MAMGFGANLQTAVILQGRKVGKYNLPTALKLKIRNEEEIKAADPATNQDKFFQSMVSRRGRGEGVIEYFGSNRLRPADRRRRSWSITLGGHLDVRGFRVGRRTGRIRPEASRRVSHKPVIVARGGVVQIGRREMCHPPGDGAGGDLMPSGLYATTGKGQ